MEITIGRDSGRRRTLRPRVHQLNVPDREVVRPWYYPADDGRGQAVNRDGDEL